MNSIDPLGEHGRTLEWLPFHDQLIRVYSSIHASLKMLLSRFRHICLRQGEHENT